MSKKDFIALADMIKRNNQLADTNTIDYDLGRVPERFSCYQVFAIADFCKSQNANFMRDRWINYITGKCGSNGGSIKKAA